MSIRAEHNSKGAVSFLPGSLTMLPVVLVITLALFYFWNVVVGLGLSSVVAVPLELVIPALVLPLLAVFVISHNERLWVYLSLCTFVIYIFRKDDGKIKPEELFYIMFVSSGIVVWLVKEVVVYRRKIIRTGFDFFFLTSWVLTNVVATIAFLLSDGKSITFLKEFLVQFTFLLYFPVRSVIQNRKHLLTVIGIVVGLALINGVNSTLTYQQRVIESALEFGAVGARAVAFEVLSMVLTVLSFTVLAYARKPLLILMGLGGTAAGIAFVVMSLSRGPIVATVLGMFAVIAMVPPRKALKLVGVFIAVIGLNLTILSVVAPNFAASILSNITDRLSTIDKLQVDRSLGSRVAESEALLQTYIPASPILGYGYGVSYQYYDIPTNQTADVVFIHNGYLAPLYKFGIPAGVLFLFMLCYPLLKSVVVHPPRGSEFPRALFVGVCGCLITIMLTNLTSSKFSNHLDIELFVVIFAVFDYLWRMPWQDGENRIGTFRTDKLSAENG